MVIGVILLAADAFVSISYIGMELFTALVLIATYGTSINLLYRYGTHWSSFDARFRIGMYCFVSISYIGMELQHLVALYIIAHIY